MFFDSKPNLLCFSVNIKGQDGINLLHVDFRPWNNVVVLNDYEDGWKTEIRYNF